MLTSAIFCFLVSSLVPQFDTLIVLITFVANKGTFLGFVIDSSGVPAI